MRYLLPFVTAIAVVIAWSTTWDLLLGMPVTLFRRKDGIATRERLARMGQLRYILTVGVLRSGLAFGLGMVTFDLLSDRSPHDWHIEAVKFVFLSLSFGLFSGASSGDAAFSKKGPPPPLVR